MALFGTQRDAKFLASINAELLNAIVDTEIEFYKLIIEDSNSNIYGESVNKTYFNYILIPALITKEGKTSEMDDYGHTYTRTAQFGISRDILEKASVPYVFDNFVIYDSDDPINVSVKELSVKKLDPVCIPNVFNKLLAILT